MSAVFGVEVEDFYRQIPACISECKSGNGSGTLQAPRKAVLRILK